MKITVMITPDDEEEKFSDDPEEQLKIENEILKLRLNAELGGKFEALSDIPADVENLFLKNVLAFEHEQAHATKKTVYEVIGKPEFKKASELNDKQIRSELNYLEALLKEKAIMVDYLVEYPDRTRYEFLTEELFKHESSMFAMPGMTTHYIYEEFHPNHDYDIRTRSEEFFKEWFNNSFSEHSTELSPVFILPNGTELHDYEVVEKVKWMLDSFVEINNAEATIQQVHFDLNEEGEGNGFSEGVATYTAVLENDEKVNFTGPFKLSFTYLHSYWQINYFTWPGFSW